MGIKIEVNQKKLDLVAIDKYLKHAEKKLVHPEIHIKCVVWTEKDGFKTI